MAKGHLQNALPRRASLMTGGLGDDKGNEKVQW